jgi:hypothetical protein
MITETCTCGSTFTFTAGGQHSSGDEALAAGAWRKDHKCNPRPPQEINLTTSVSAEVAATLVALLEDARRRGDLR